MERRVLRRIFFVVPSEGSCRPSRLFERSARCAVRDKCAPPPFRNPPIPGSFMASSPGMVRRWIRSPACLHPFAGSANGCAVARWCMIARRIKGRRPIAAMGSVIWERGRCKGSPRLAGAALRPTGRDSRRQSGTSGAGRDAWPTKGRVSPEPRAIHSLSREHERRQVPDLRARPRWFRCFAANAAPAPGGGRSSPARGGVSPFAHRRGHPASTKPARPACAGMPRGVRAAAAATTRSLATVRLPLRG